MAETIQLTLAHSPDADDMVMWWPLTGMRRPDGTPVEGRLGQPRIETGRFRFETTAADVQALNRRAIERGDFDITAISAHAYPHVKDRYAITACGGSFGEGYGPRVVVRASDLVADLRALALEAARTGEAIAAPGMHTTAYLVFRILLGEDRPPRVMELPFAEIPGAVASGTARAGLLIHEAQLTYESTGLRLLADLGVHWRERTGDPLPLGLNVVRRDLDERFGAGTVEQVARMLARSVEFAREHASESREFLRMHSVSRPEWEDDSLVARYLAMYVSDLTLNMGVPGRGAIRRLLATGANFKLCPDPGSVDVIAL